MDFFSAHSITPLALSPISVHNWKALLDINIIGWQNFYLLLRKEMKYGKITCHFSMPKLYERQRWKAMQNSTLTTAYGSWPK
jgi:hypothetical protein